MAKVRCDAVPICLAQYTFSPSTEPLLSLYITHLVNIQSHMNVIYHTVHISTLQNMTRVVVMHYRFSH